MRTRIFGKGYKMDILTALATFSMIETEHLYLRPFSFADAEAFFTISQNADNLDFIFPQQETKAASDYLLVHGFLKSPLGVWAIEDKVSQSLIGAIKCEKTDLLKQETEIGYFVKKEFQGRGLATEALSKVARICLKACRFKKLHLITHLDNIASQRVAEKTGFRCVRRYKGSDRYTHKVRQYLAFEMTRGDDHE